MSSYHHSSQFILQQKNPEIDQALDSFRKGDFTSCLESLSSAAAASTSSSIIIHQQNSHESNHHTTHSTQNRNNNSSSNENFLIIVATIYSHRSLVHRILENFSDSLGDARKVIDLCPKWFRGHQRAAQTLAKMKNFKQALFHAHEAWKYAQEEILNSNNTNNNAPSLFSSSSFSPSPHEEQQNMIHLIRNLEFSEMIENDILMTSSRTQDDQQQQAAIIMMMRNPQVCVRILDHFDLIKHVLDEELAVQSFSNFIIWIVDVLARKDLQIAELVLGFQVAFRTALTKCFKACRYHSFRAVEVTANAILTLSTFVNAAAVPTRTIKSSSSVVALPHNNDFCCNPEIASAIDTIVSSPGLTNLNSTKWILLVLVRKLMGDDSSSSLHQTFSSRAFVVEFLVGKLLRELQNVPETQRLRELGSEILNLIILSSSSSSSSCNSILPHLHEKGEFYNMIVTTLLNQHRISPTLLKITCNIIVNMTNKFKPAFSRLAYSDFISAFTNILLTVDGEPLVLGSIVHLIALTLNNGEQHNNNNSEAAAQSYSQIHVVQGLIRCMKGYPRDTSLALLALLGLVRHWLVSPQRFVHLSRIILTDDVDFVNSALVEVLKSIFIHHHQHQGGNLVEYLVSVATSLLDVLTFNRERLLLLVKSQGADENNKDAAGEQQPQDEKSKTETENEERKTEENNHHGDESSSDIPKNVFKSQQLRDVFASLRQFIKNDQSSTSLIELYETVLGRLDGYLLPQEDGNKKNTTDENESPKNDDGNDNDASKKEQENTNSEPEKSKDERDETKNQEQDSEAKEETALKEASNLFEELRSLFPALPIFKDSDIKKIRRLFHHHDDRTSSNENEVFEMQIVPQRNKKCVGKIYSDRQHAIAIAKIHETLDHVNILPLIGLAVISSIDSKNDRVALLTQQAKSDLGSSLFSSTPIPGKPPSSIVKNGSIPLERIYRFSLQISSALSYLHCGANSEVPLAADDDGVKKVETTTSTAVSNDKQENSKTVSDTTTPPVLCNIKPGNILLFDGDLIKLTEFCDSESLEAEFSSKRNLSSSSSSPPRAHAGIDRFKAPERCDLSLSSTAENHNQDSSKIISSSPASDIYSFGMVLFELISGIPLHSIKNEDEAKTFGNCPIINPRSIAFRVRELGEDISKMGSALVEGKNSLALVASTEVLEKGKKLIKLCENCLMLDPSKRVYKNGTELHAELLKCSRKECEGVFRQFAPADVVEDYFGIFAMPKKPQSLIPDEGQNDEGNKKVKKENDENNEGWQEEEIDDIPEDDIQLK